MNTEQNFSSRESMRMKDEKQMEKDEKFIPGTCSDLSSNDKKRNWSLPENKGYIQFLRENFKSFEHERDRRERKIFLEMSFFLSCSKTPEQCRTHHQKALQKYGSLENILNQLLEQAQMKNAKKLSQVNKLLEKKEDYEVYHSKNAGIKIKILGKSFLDW